MCERMIQMRIYSRNVLPETHTHTISEDPARRDCWTAGMRSGVLQMRNLVRRRNYLEYIWIAVFNTLRPSRKTISRILYLFIFFLLLPFFSYLQSSARRVSGSPGLVWLTGVRWGHLKPVSKRMRKLQSRHQNWWQSELCYIKDSAHNAKRRRPWEIRHDTYWSIQLP